MVSVWEILDIAKSIKSADLEIDWTCVDEVLSMCDVNETRDDNFILNVLWGCKSYELKHEAYIQNTFNTVTKVAERKSSEFHDDLRTRIKKAGFDYNIKNALGENFLLRQAALINQYIDFASFPNLLAYYTDEKTDIHVKNNDGRDIYYYLNRWKWQFSAQLDVLEYIYKQINFHDIRFNQQALDNIAEVSVNKEIISI